MEQTLVVNENLGPSFLLALPGKAVSSLDPGLYFFHIVENTYPTECHWSPNSIFQGHLRIFKGLKIMRLSYTCSLSASHSQIQVQIEFPHSLYSHDQLVREETQFGTDLICFSLWLAFGWSYQMRNTMKSTFVSVFQLTLARAFIKVFS